VPSPVRFAVVRRLLEAKGYALTRITGSHHMFTKAGRPLVSIPVHRNQVKHVYYKIAQEAP
jgi:predicted RNA binding protein YcfA (HicA-like mRNA interferase family)